MLFRRRRQRARRMAREAASTGFDVLDRRLPLAEAAKQLLRKAFPDHWSFLLGELALYSFVVLLLTGTWLTLFFEPGTRQTIYHGGYVPLQGLQMSQAYESTVHISLDVRGGLLMRQMHHWAALLFIASIGVHMLRIFFTGAFRRPREGNWMTGIALFILALLEGFAGYSLPDDLLSGTGLRTAFTIVESIPLVGTYLAFFAWGGEFPGHLLNSRLYIVHVLLVPALLVALVTVHLFLVVYLKHTQWAGQGRTNRNAVGQPMFPQFTAKTTGLLLSVFGVTAGLATVAQINPIWVYGPFRADQVSTDAQPDWYVGFLDGALRLMPPWETTFAGHAIMWNVLLPAIVMPGLLFTLLLFYPVFERWLTGDVGEHHLCDRPRDKAVRTAFGVAGIVWYAVLLTTSSTDVIAFTFRVSLNTLVWIFRFGVIVLPILAFMLTKRLCLALQAHERHELLRGEETGEVSQSVYGAIVPGHRPVPVARWYRFLVRDMPRPIPAPRDGASRRMRVRSALSHWYFGSRVEIPPTITEREHIKEIQAQPDRRSS
ncbi:cytochrome bc1 complex cytochrome b subunit [Actinacidiphila acidipaludis]|uniref:Cytochrome bc1 complex cytochrome b subunit n=1 Tax=Actinacidiphila acidipaludis TaxID=2873382 RepID=A0ABS7QGC3_9ACTN|nr:cytochrome b N-terminal domain-containing protein [Streptomyces acidipaludis]MBY8882217.1 cytochrome b N-terminal domain-containing protein [Streptomyces acidipaludis]